MMRGLKVKAITSKGKRQKNKMAYGWSHEDFAIIFKGIAQWKKEGKQEALWLNYANHASAERARGDLLKNHHALDVSVLGSIVIVNAGMEHIEKEVDTIKVHKHFDAKLRAAIYSWQHNSYKRPLVLEFMTKEEAGLAKDELQAYTNDRSENAIAYGTKLILPTTLGHELEKAVA